MLVRVITFIILSIMENMINKRDCKTWKDFQD